MSELYDKTYNPDVLSCLANLSNDEVFTPPEVANQMLDMLPKEIWSNPDATFLDPACKSGVFLREIAKRLIKGLEDVYPDLDERLEHIFKKQLYGVAITELTSLLSRRGVYCSKYPNSRYSVVEFDEPEGNIRFRRCEHAWVNGKCRYCGASQEEYDRGDNLETHAYEFIHQEDPKGMFPMKFDIIAGNPPYQLSDGGAQQSAKPIYQHFIQNAKKLNPRYLTMIVPARWYSGGKGLDAFRNEMLNDRHIASLHDFPDTSDCFGGGVNIRGGVCYFLWSRDYDGDCTVYNHKGSLVESVAKRPLLESGMDTFIRWNQAVEILEKVKAHNEQSFMDYVSSRKSFGLATNFRDFEVCKSAEKSIELFRFGKNGYVSEDQIPVNREWLDGYKIFEPYASPGSDDYPHLVLSEPIVVGPGTACSETYLVIGPFEDESTANNVASYMRTQLFRFLLLLRRSAQHVTKKVYQFAPVQDFSKLWTNEMLYQKYGITEDEIRLIDSLVKPLACDRRDG